MKYLAATLLTVCLLATSAMAHTLFMNVNDNEDGTVTVEGIYSTGGAAAKTSVRLEDADGRVLVEGKTDEDGEFDFRKPSVPYVIIMDAGPGHIATEEGM